MRKLGITKGDLDGFTGLFVDNLSSIILMITLNLYVVQIPAEIVFGRILPGTAIGLLAGNLYYVYMAKKLMKKTGRDDVTALPTGMSVVLVIAYTMGVLLPVAKLTGDPELAWRIGLAANIIGALICLLGAFIGPWLRKFLPSASMLGALAGLGVIYIAGAGIVSAFSNPVIGFVSLAIVLWGYLANGKLPLRLPPGLVALVLGVIIALCMGKTSVSMENIGVYAPIPWIFKISIQTFKECGPYLAMIIPIAVINFITTLNSVESAVSVGDEYNIREAMLCDGIVSMVGVVFGCCYPNCVFIGHPGYKRMGARLSYSLLNGIAVTLLAIFGLFGLINSLIPLAAVAPLLIFVGIVNVDVAFTEVPKQHRTAVGIALLPFVGEYAKEQVDNGLSAMGAVGTDPAVQAALAANGVDYVGFTVISQGTTLVAMMLAAIVAFAIDRKLLHAAGTAFAGAALSAVGLIHAAQLSLLPNVEIAVAWALLGVLALIAHFATQRQKGRNCEPLQPGQNG